MIPYLPIDIIEKIVLFLDKLELFLTMSLVCSGWNRIFCETNIILWREITLNHCQKFNFLCSVSNTKWKELFQSYWFGVTSINKNYLQGE